VHAGSHGLREPEQSLLPRQLDHPCLSLHGCVILLPFVRKW
jgi:hypothetical protein